MEKGCKISFSFQFTGEVRVSLFIVNTSKISGPKRSVKITDRFTCISANVIYCITCTLCNKLYIGETGRRLGDRFREHLRDVEKNDKDASKPVARHFNLPNHSKKHMAICSLSLHLGTTESRKNLEQKLARFPHRSLLHYAYTPLFQENKAITIDVLWDCGALFFLFRGFFSKSIWTLKKSVEILSEIRKIEQFFLQFRHFSCNFTHFSVFE